MKAGRRGLESRVGVR